MELPFVQAVEQGCGGFIGKVGKFGFIGKRGNLAGQLRQFFQRPNGNIPRMFGGKTAEGFLGRWCASSMQ